MKTHGRSLTLDDAITGFLMEKDAAAYSRYTLRNYRLALRRLTAFLDATTPIAEISAADITRFMRWLGNLKPEPGGCAPRQPKPLSKKTLRNHHTALSSLWTWAVAHGYAERHVVHDVPAPEPNQPTIHPLSSDNVKAMLAACGETTQYRHHKSGKLVSNARPTAQRDRAILLTLYDTGIRASELCDLTEALLDLRNRTIKIHEGKGSKDRIVPIAGKTARAIWTYQTQERPTSTHANVFLNVNGQPLNRDALLKMVKRVGKRAGVRNAFPHRFRHTFAITYLRNRGDVYTLKNILGHSTLEMVNRYLEIANSDVAAAHKTASPVANL
jgi:site-specific recombinase XerD